MVCSFIALQILRADLLAIAGGPNSSKDGKPGTQEDRRVEHIIPREAISNGKYQFIIELSVNAMFGLGLNGFRHQRPDVCLAHDLNT